MKPRDEPIREILITLRSPIHLVVGPVKTPAQLLRSDRQLSSPDPPGWQYNQNDTGRIVQKFPQNWLVQT